MYSGQKHIVLGVCFKHIWDHVAKPIEKRLASAPDSQLWSDKKSAALLLSALLLLRVQFFFFFSLAKSAASKLGI